MKSCYGAHVLIKKIRPAFHSCKKIDGFSLLKGLLGLRRHWGNQKEGLRHDFSRRVYIGEKQHDISLTFTRICIVLQCFT